VKPRGPPEAVVEVVGQRGYEHRADQQRVDQDAERDDGAELREHHEREHGEGGVALEPQAAPRRLAQGNVRDAGLADRVEIRAGRIEELDDREAFDLVWLPGNFLGSDALPRAFAVAHRALRPGGYLLNACLGGGGDDHRSTAARLRAVLWGGDTVAPEHVGGLLREAGFADVALMDRLPSGLVPMQARRAL
jgi:SAM-dependent methyltransferase